MVFLIPLDVLDLLPFPWSSAMSKFSFSTVLSLWLALYANSTAAVLVTSSVRAHRHTDAPGRIADSECEESETSELARVRDADMDADEEELVDAADAELDGTHALDLENKATLEHAWFFDKMIYLIRHAEPECLDGPFTERGMQQAKALRKRWPHTFKGVEVILTSPYVGCMQTAYQAFKQPQKVEINPYIMSLTAGRLQRTKARKTFGISQTQQMLEQYEHLWGNHTDATESEPLDSNFDSDPDGMGTNVRSDDGDLEKTYALRFSHFVEQLKRRNETKIAIVTHSPIIELIVGKHSNLHMAKGSCLVRGFKDGAFTRPESVNDRIYDDEREIGDKKDKRLEEEKYLAR